MDPTEIIVFMILVGVAAGSIVSLEPSVAAASARRLMRMIQSIGLDSRTDALGDPQTMRTAVQKFTTEAAG